MAFCTWLPLTRRNRRNEEHFVKLRFLSSHRLDIILHAPQLKLDFMVWSIYLSIYISIYIIYIYIYIYIYILSIYLKKNIFFFLDAHNFVSRKWKCWIVVLWQIRSSLYSRNSSIEMQLIIGSSPKRRNISLSIILWILFCLMTFPIFRKGARLQH